MSSFLILFLFLGLPSEAVEGYAEPLEIVANVQGRKRVAGGAAHDYTGDTNAYANYTFNASGCTDTMGTAARDLTEQATVTWTTGTGLKEGSTALSADTNGDSCKGTPTSPPYECSGAGCTWSTGFFWHATETTASFQSIMQIGTGNDATTGVIQMRQNTDTAMDVRIGGGNGSNIFTVALNTDQHLAVVYDGDNATEWAIYLNGGSGGSCSGSTYTNSALTPASTAQTEIEFGGGDAADILGITDDAFIHGDVLTQTQICEIYLNCFDGDCS